MLDVKLKLKPGHAAERSWMAPSTLRQLFWNVTYACNYRCAICFTDAGRAHPDELTTQEALALVDAAHEAGVEDIIMSGGEPFMRKDLADILARMAEVGITARIASNGSLLSDAVLDRLRGETLTKSFQVSLDTLDPALLASSWPACGACRSAASTRPFRSASARRPCPASRSSSTGRWRRGGPR